AASIRFYRRRFPRLVQLKKPPHHLRDSKSFRYTTACGFTHVAPKIRIIQQRSRLPGKRRLVSRRHQEPRLAIANDFRQRRKWRSNNGPPRRHRLQHRIEASIGPARRPHDLCSSEERGHVWVITQELDSISDAGRPSKILDGVPVGAAADKGEVQPRV